MMRLTVTVLLGLAACTGGGGELLSVHANAVSTIALDDDNVYWIETSRDATTCDPTNGTIYRIPKTGGDEVVLVHQGCADDLVVADGQLYWTAGGEYEYAGGVFTMPVTGGTPLQLTASSAHRLAIDATNLYWTSGQPGDGGSGQVSQMPRGGGNILTLSSGELGREGIAIDTTSVYWTEPNGDSFENGEIVKAPIGGTGSDDVVLAEGFGPDVGGAPYYIAVRGGMVYWTGANTISSAPIGGGGGAADVIASGDWIQSAIAVDDARVYWNDGFTGRLFAMLRDGGPVISLVDRESGGEGIALDATHAYFSGPDGLYRVAL
jgi:hypothetical protein